VPQDIGQIGRPTDRQTQSGNKCVNGDFGNGELSNDDFGNGHFGNDDLDVSRFPAW
jgi:hypothetical protein